MCGYHMVSEDSPQRFVFRARGSVAYTSECVKIQFHVLRQEPETTMFTVGFRVFDGCTPIFTLPSRMMVKTSFLDDNQEQGKCVFFFDLITMRTRKSRVKQVPLCFWSIVPVFFRHCETMTKISQNPLSCLYSYC